MSVTRAENHKIFVPHYSARKHSGYSVILPITRYVYYAFVLSIPFESADLGVGLSNFTPSKMIGYVFIALALLQSHISFRKPPKAFWCFSTYIFIIFIVGVLSGPYDTEIQTQFIRRLVQLVQFTVLFWVSYNFMHREEVVKGTLLALAISTTVLSILQMIGLTNTVMMWGQFERSSAFGDDPNTFAAVLSLGLLALVGIAYGRKEINGKLRLLAWTGFGIIVMGILSTGSRSSLVALMAGLLVLLLQGKSRQSKIKIGLIIAAALGLMVWVSYNTEGLRQRWEQSLIDSKLSKREVIWPAAVEMVLEKPLIGWGPIIHVYELGTRTGRSIMDTHNIFLWLMTETGLVGTFFFLAGMWLCIQSAWKARRGSQSVLPLALLTCLVIFNLGITWYNRKLFWLILAYALASASYVSTPRRRQVKQHVYKPFAY